MAASLSRSPETRPLHDEKVEIRQHQAGSYLCELDSGCPAHPVAVVEQRTCGSVVEDIVAGVLGPGPDDEESFRREPASGECAEYGVLQLDRVVGHVEIQDTV